MKRLVKVSLILSCMALLLASCNCFHGIKRKIDRIEVKSSPTVLTLKGSNVTADVTVTFPPKYFNKHAILKVTPVLVFAGGEIAGTPKFIQGERVRDNYTVIPFRDGGSYTQTVSFPFDERARISKLELRMEASCGARCADRSFKFTPLAPIHVADGVSTIQNMANLTDYMSFMADNFKKAHTISQDAEILYLINKADVRPAQLTSQQIKMFEEFVKENKAAEKVALGNVQSKGYASPDGPTQFNEDLSKKRSETGKEAISKQLADVDVRYDISHYGEDWEGFQELVRASDIKDKDLILQVLSMYSSSTKREQEIRNMSSVFNVLAEQILPQLRRTKFVANADVQAKSDAEILSAVKNNITSLELEELLYAGTLVQTNAERVAIYQAAANKFNDARAFNNLGVALAKEGKFAEAQKALEQAAKLQSATEISNNLGITALAQGDTATARKYLSSLSSQDAQRNMALINLKEGNFAEASRNLTGYNLAVAELANGNVARAKTALGDLNDANSLYLRAVIAQREGNASQAMTNLKQAIAKDPSLKAKAQQDVEFIKLFNTPEFLAL